MGREGRAVQRDPSTTNAGKGAACGVGKAPPGGRCLNNGGLCLLRGRRKERPSGPREHTKKGLGDGDSCQVQSHLSTADVWDVWGRGDLGASWKTLTQILDF